MATIIVYVLPMFYIYPGCINSFKARSRILTLIRSPLVYIPRVLIKYMLIICLAVTTTRTANIRRMYWIRSICKVYTDII